MSSTKKEQVESEQHRAQLRNHNTIAFALCSGILLLCIVLYLLWKRSQQTKKNLKEKEVLLREIHHRVKNNLAVISGLLYLQKSRVTDEHVKEILVEGQNRISSMILVHEMLYQSNDITSIELNSYLKKLIQQIAKGFKHPQLLYSVSGSVILPPKQAVPLGLILTELITNIYKYAYPGETGKFDLEISQTNNKHIHIELRDYGKGLPAGFDVSKSDSLGLQLVTMLTEQMEGDIKFQNDNGTRVTLNFTVDEE